MGVNNPLLTNNLSYPRIKKKLLFCETTDQYLVANFIDGYTLRNFNYTSVTQSFKKLWVAEVYCLLAGADIGRVTHEFVRYPRIQLTRRT